MISIKTGPAFNERRTLAEQLAASVDAGAKNICSELLPERERERVARELDTVIRRQHFYRIQRFELPGANVVWWPAENVNVAVCENPRPLAGQLLDGFTDDEGH